MENKTLITEFIEYLENVDKVKFGAIIEILHQIMVCNNPILTKKVYVDDIKEYDFLSISGVGKTKYNNFTALFNEYLENKPKLSTISGKVKKNVIESKTPIEDLISWLERRSFTSSKLIFTLKKIVESREMFRKQFVEELEAPDFLKFQGVGERTFNEFIRQSKIFINQLEESKLSLLNLKIDKNLIEQLNKIDDTIRFIEDAIREKLDRDRVEIEQCKSIQQSKSDIIKVEITNLQQIVDILQNTNKQSGVTK